MFKTQVSRGVVVAFLTFLAFAVGAGALSGLWFTAFLATSVSFAACGLLVLGLNWIENGR